MNERFCLRCGNELKFVHHAQKYCGSQDSKKGKGTCAYLVLRERKAKAQHKKWKDDKIWRERKLKYAKEYRKKHPDKRPKEYFTNWFHNLSEEKKEEYRRKDRERARLKRHLATQG